MLKITDNVTEKTSQVGDYEFRHEKNAFVVGDKVLVWRSGKPSYKVWRTVKSVDTEQGKLYFEDSTDWWTIHSSTENKKDNIVTTEAWDRAFKNCEAWKNDKDKKGYVVSYEMVDKVLCVVITNNTPRIHTKWYYRHDNGSFVKKEDTNVKKKSLWVCREGTDTVIRIANNSRAVIGEKDAVIDPDWGWFEEKAKGRPVVWIGEKAKEICEKCPWLLEKRVLWKYGDKEGAMFGRPFIAFILERRKAVLKYNETQLKVLLPSEIKENDAIIDLNWIKITDNWKFVALKAAYARRICKLYPWMLTKELRWFFKNLNEIKITTGQKVIDWFDGKINTDMLNGKTTEKPKEEHSDKTIKKSLDSSESIVGKKVSHKQYGVGEIAYIEEKNNEQKICVLFKSETKYFKYPFAFEKGFLNWLVIDKPHKLNDKGLKVIFRDGTVISECSAVETFMEALIRIGLSKVASSGIKHGKGQFNLVSTEKSSIADSNNWQRKIGDYYIFINLSNVQKRNDLLKLSKMFDLGLEVEEGK